MPTNLFSTSSTRPTPCLPPSLFNVFITPSGIIFLPLTPTALPRSKSSVTNSGLSGASSGATLKTYIPLCSGAEASSHPRVFQNPRPERNVQKVPIHRIRLPGRRLHRDALFLAILDHLRPSGK